MNKNHTAITKNY